MVVGVDQSVLALRPSEEFTGPIGQHLVDVHVVRRAGTRLIHVHDELIAERTVQNLVGRFHDCVADTGVQAAELDVRAGRRLLDEDGGGDELRGGVQAADREVFDGARRLDAVVGVSGNRMFAEGIALDAGHANLARSEARA